jgi:3-methyladenine DNA glycosylase/8-oxoguanine DNA glycosylase
MSVDGVFGFDPRAPSNTCAEAHRMGDEEIIERLTEVRGIGRWTAEMVLMFRTGRPDVLPADDYGIRQGFAIAFKKRELPARNDVERRGARWKPYRTVASWYLWRAVELRQNQRRAGGGVMSRQTLERRT